MRMQRVELSIRQFPLSSFLCRSLFSQPPLPSPPAATVGKVHLQSFHHLLFPHFLRRSSCGLLLLFLIFMDYLPALSSATGAVLFTHQRALSPHCGCAGGVGWVPEWEPGLACCCTAPLEKQERPEVWRERGSGQRGLEWTGEVERLRLGEEWLCRLLVHLSCCCSTGCVSFRHSPAPPRHEPRRKGVLLHAQLLCKSTGFYSGVRFYLWVQFVMGVYPSPCFSNSPACVHAGHSVGNGGWGCWSTHVSAAVITK